MGLGEGTPREGRGRGRGPRWGAIYFTIKTGVQISAERDSGSPRGPSAQCVRRAGLRGDEGMGGELGFRFR